jgi:hypothetical protein
MDTRQPRSARSSSGGRSPKAAELSVGQPAVAPGARAREASRHAAPRPLWAAGRTDRGRRATLPAAAAAASSSSDRRRRGGESGGPRGTARSAPRPAGGRRRPRLLANSSGPAAVGSLSKSTTTHGRGTQQPSGSWSSASWARRATPSCRARAVRTRQVVLVCRRDTGSRGTVDVHTSRRRRSSMGRGRVRGSSRTSAPRRAAARLDPPLTRPAESVRSAVLAGRRDVHLRPPSSPI